MVNYRQTTHREDELLFYLDEKYGPAPFNNFKSLRMDRGLSLQQLASALGISKNALVRLENGTYANPLDAALNYWVKRGASYPALIEGYSDFQYYTRQRAHLYFGPSLRVYTRRSLPHPLRQLRQYRTSPVDNAILPVGIEQVSRDLCLPVDTLRHFEKKFRRQQSVPKSLKAVLNQIGYTQAQVQTFERDYHIWRKNNLAIETVDLLGPDLSESA